jgi:SMC interacting uncharacterized protein involved in chromosome segregation
MNKSTPAGTKMRKLYKRIKTNLDSLEESMNGIEEASDEERKEKVIAISSSVIELDELLQDLNLQIDEIAGDDTNKASEIVLEEFDQLDVISSLVDNFQSNLKNFHKTYYNKTIDKDLKILAYGDLSRAWNTLQKNVMRVLDSMDSILGANV